MTVTGQNNSIIFCTSRVFSAAQPFDRRTLEIGHFPPMKGFFQVAIHDTDSFIVASYVPVIAKKTI